MGTFLENIKAKIANINFGIIVTSLRNFIFTLLRIKIFKISLLYIVLAVVVLGGLIFAIAGVRKSSATTVAQVQIAGPKATQTLNREFDFPLTDSTGKQVGSFKYIIESVDLRNEIVVKGQKATAVAGKTFMVINLKIVNELNQGVQINTKDYVRLSVNGNKDEWLAPDIHNDPVDVQAISTKLTRIGYAVSNSDKNIILRVGEINGAKTEVPVKFN
jgi:hypothetical protein